MYKGKTISVVVPAFNEEKLIGRVIETTPGFVDKIIVVDDCSQDQTAQIVGRYQAESPDRVVLLTHATNQGVGGAITTGYKWCRDQEMDVAVVMAGDAQMDPADLPALLDPVVEDKADYAKGNRLFTGEAWKLIPRWRYLGTSGLSLLTKIASGYWHVADSQSGYTAINLKALKTIDWDQMYKRYGQPNDLLVRLNVFNFRVQDVPIKPVYNIGEQSGISPWKMIPKLSILLLRLFLWRMFHKYVIRDFHPLIFFYLMGGMLQFFSLTLFLRMIYIWAIIGDLPSINTLMFVFTTVLGVQFLLFAMWFDMEYNRHLR
jgi:glycosyltransferase involved in cell wall biosynthesis